MQKPIPLYILTLILILGMTQKSFSGKVKVFILAGQSNMEGYATVWSHNPTPQPNGTLDWLLQQPEHQADFEHLVAGYDVPGNDSLIFRDDVWVSYKGAGHAVKHSNWKIPGFGVNNPKHSGPESGMGWILGEHYQDQVLLIKTAWGGHSLGVNFLPPSSTGGPGPSYTNMVNDVNEVLNDIKGFFPTYNDEGYEIVGFQWFQGWNDQYNGLDSVYEENMVNFIKDVRQEFSVTDMPFVIAETGNSFKIGDPRSTVSLAQEAAADPVKHPEFKDNVAYVPTNQLADWTLAPYTGFYYHWAGSFYSYYNVGKLMGEAMIGLLPQNTPVTVNENSNKFVTQRGMEFFVNSNVTHVFRIYDFRGKELYSNSHKGSKSYSLTELKKSGVYIVKVNTLNSESWHKILIN